MIIDINSPFYIGNLKLANRLIQAPLAGISCAPFRELFSLYTNPAYAVTEMISANSILQPKTLARRYLERSNQEGLWCIQLSGTDPKLLADAVQYCETLQPDLIDLNCGCPKTKIRSKGAGSALIESPQKLQAIVSAMRAATNLPLTVKIRTAGNTDDHRFLEAARIIADAGADAIIVHGRHFSEDYSQAANYSQIKQVCAIVDIPVIANGDISDAKNARLALEQSEADAIMIGRASIGKPWLFQELLGTSVAPSKTERLEIFQKHIQNLAKIEGGTYHAVMQGRRLLKWYFPELSTEELAQCYQPITDLSLIETLQKNI